MWLQNEQISLLEYYLFRDNFETLAVPFFVRWFVVSFVGLCAVNFKRSRKQSKTVERLNRKA